MRPGISITLDPCDGRRLKAIVFARNTPQKRVWRAEIALLSADGVGMIDRGAERAGCPLSIA